VNSYMQLPKETQGILGKKYEGIIRMLEKDRTIVTDSMSEITPHVYLSGLMASLNIDALREEKIRSVLYLCEDNKESKTLKLYAKKKIEHCHIPLADMATADLSAIFNSTYAYIRDRVEKNTKILVHCAAGVSRSVIVVAHFYLVRFYLANQHNKKVQKKIMNPRKYFACKILSMIKENRPCIGPNPGFLRQLLVAEYKMKMYFTKLLPEKQDPASDESESDSDESDPEPDPKRYDSLDDLKKIAPSASYNL
jgi:hypothetical protein